MDNAIGLGIILSLQDRASAGLEKIRNKMTVLRDVSQDMMKRFDEGAKQMLAGFASMAAGAKVLGVFSSTFGASIITATDFEQAMARVGAVSGAVGDDFERLSKQARDLGRDTQFSASQAAASQENLARAGFKTNEIINAMPGLLNMAAAEGMDLANAADIASSAIRGFGLDASEANRVADVLAKTSSASNTSIALLGESLKYVAPLAKGLGVSIEQTNAMLGVMANAGIKGSQAGTSLKSAFQRLSEEPTRVSKALAELGIHAKTSQGNLRPLPEIMKDLSAKMAGMGKGDKIGMLSKIFGGVASSGMLAIMDSVANGSLPELEAALYSCSGAAREMADRMNATAQGAMLRLESASEGLRIAIGNHLLSAYTWIIDKMAEFKSWLTQLIEAHPVISKAVIGLTTALIGLSGATLIFVGALASIGGFIKMWPLLKIMAVSALSNIKMQAHMALSALSGLSVPVVAMIALAGALYYAWRKNLWGIRDMVTAVSEGFKMALSASTDGIAEVDEELANKLKAAGIWDFAVTMGQVFFRVRQFWNGLVEGFQEGLDFLKEGFNWLKDLFAPAIESGQELLKFLGIFKPVADTQTSTWKAWGQLIGRIAPIVLGVIAAFKGFAIVVGIIKAITGAAALLNAVLLANPVMAIAAIMIAAGIYIYTHWEEISEWFADIWNNIASYGQAAADWVMQKWQEVSNWWNSWTLPDVFAYLGDMASNAINYVKGLFSSFGQWIMDTIGKLNPFNWELPSWLGGGNTGNNQVNNANAALSGYQPPSIPAYATGGIISQPHLGLVGEAGREAIIPLEDRNNGIPLLMSAISELGINGNDFMPYLNTVEPEFESPSINIPAPALPSPLVNVPIAPPVPVNVSIFPIVSPAPVNVQPTNVNIPPLEQALSWDMSGFTNVINSLRDNMNNEGNSIQLVAPKNQAPSSPLLIQHAQNQAAMNGQAQVQAQEHSPERPINVNSHVDVTIEGKPVELYIDSEKIGSVVLRWDERQSTRSGVSPF